MLSAFKLKEFDLTPVLEGWKDGPIFYGDSKKDMPVEEWLEKIKEGCVQRGVPEEYWYKVGQHFMGPVARGRLTELKQVITKVHGGKYRWTWRKFKVAMMNMGWTIDKDKKETIKIQGKGSGLWFMRKKDTMVEPTPDKSDAASVKSHSSDSSAPESSGKKTLSRSPSTWLTKKALVEEPEEEEEPVIINRKDVPPRSTLNRSTTVAFWPARGNKDTKELPPRPVHQKARSETVVTTVSKKGKAVDRSGTVDSEHSNTEVVKEAQAPAWLLNACTALEYITSEHPKAMSIISAILITAGSIPSIPVIAAGAGGAVLASSAAHALGAIAVGVGQALSAGVTHQQKKDAGSTSGHN